MLNELVLKLRRAFPKENIHLTLTYMSTAEEPTEVEAVYYLHIGEHIEKIQTIVDLLKRIGELVSETEENQYFAHRRKYNVN